MVAVLAVVVGWAATAAADGGDEGTEASLFVQQAVALIANTPDAHDAIDDKISDAIEAPDQHGVDITLVEQAGIALEADDVHLARSLLEESIGARLHLDASDPVSIDEHLEEANEEGPATAPFLDPLDTSRDVSGGDWAMMGVAIVLILAGAATARRVAS